MATNPSSPDLPLPGAASRRKLRICVLGNSVGLKMRPPRQHSAHKTYTELLMRTHEVHNACRAGALITEQFGLLDDEVISRFPDVTILHFGIVELYHRTTIRRLNNAPIVNYYNNQVLGRPYRFGLSPSTFVLRVVKGLLRRAASLVGLEWRWLGTDRYLQVLEAMCGVIVAETASKVVIIEVPLIPPESTKFSASTNTEISRANATTRRWASESGGRLVSLAVDEGVDPSRWVRLMPDAVHFSAVGHRCVHSLLRRAIETTP